MFEAGNYRRTGALFGAVVSSAACIKHLARIVKHACPCELPRWGGAELVTWHVAARDVAKKHVHLILDPD